MRSTPGRVRPSAGRHQQKHSTSNYGYSNNPVLQRPLESSQYTSWIFGHRLRAAGLLGSMGRVASSVDNALIESFWSSMQRELLDRQQWRSREQLASAMFEWIEGWYNPRRRHSSIGNLSPHEYEALHTAAFAAA